MAKTADYKNGYNEAIEAIKKALQGGQQSGGGQQGGSNDGRDMDLSGTPAGDAMEANGQDPQLSGGSSSSSGSDDSRGSGEQGTVTAADCAGRFGDDVPQTPGGFMDTDEGNKLAKEEGYEEGPGGDTLSKQWKETALQAAKQKDHGNKAGSFIEKINSLWKTSKDWKKTLRKIVGRSLNTQDKRQAFANKNILATQNRVARTDKDRFDAVDYMCMFVDSSGSMSNNELSIACTEVYNIALALKPITMVYGTFDTEVNDCQIFHDAKSFKNYVSSHGIKGRGGTEAKSVWKFLRNDKRFKGKTAELVVVVSDGDYSCNSCKRDPKIMTNLCWIQFDSPGWESDFKDTRTTTVHLSTEDIK